MKIILGILLLIISVGTFAKSFELGLETGSPTGISAKYNLEDNKAIDGALAYSLINDYGLNIHIDYLVENAKTLEIEGPEPLEVFYGFGARFVSVKRGPYDGRLGFGPRAPVGVNYNLHNPNIDFFAEIALAFDIFPETKLDLEGGIGIRYRF